MAVGGSVVGSVDAASAARRRLCIKPWVWSPGLFLVRGRAGLDRLRDPRAIKKLTLHRIGGPDILLDEQ